jgi:gamma-glutamylcyclotransferase (GGCT)/AIG2-like uncharacterized protein YtfP
MSPSVLSRVISGEPHLDTQSPLRIHAGQLCGYRRNRVRDVDYPAVSKSSASDSVFGTLVYNLSSEEVRRLDTFEGDEYAREKVLVIDDVTGQSVSAFTYVWIDSMERLLLEEWDFNDFVE